MVKSNKSALTGQMARHPLPVPLDNIPTASRNTGRPWPPSVPEHQLLRQIGGGSSGEVWLARNMLGAYRAVKIVPNRGLRPGQPLPHEYSGVLRFEPVSRLHDGLTDVLQVGVTEAGDFYCVMEVADDAVSGQTIVPERYVPRTLAYDLSQHGRLPIGECVRNGAAVASALGFLHRQGLIHRDIKPSNIIFVNGFPKLADIGLVAAATEPRAFIGTDGFIPPEGAGTPQADIYSLGKILYQMSTGRDRNDYPALPANLGKSPEDQELLRFNKIVLHACRTQPFLRFRSADDLLTALLSFQFWTSELRHRQVRQHWGKVIGLCGLAIGLAVLCFLVLRLAQLLGQGQ